MGRSKYEPLIIALILTIALPHLLIPQARVPSRSSSSMNLLMISIDTLRADRLGCYGNEDGLTPSIDALAKKGTLFSRAFAHAPTTLPSHASMLLGTTPLVHGVHDNAGFIVAEESLSVAELLKDRGFSTGAFVGAFPLDSRFGLAQGFDTYDDDFEKVSTQKFAYGERKAEVVVGRALDWLKGQASPWFLMVHLFDPHYPYVPPEPFMSRFKEQPYDGEVAYADSAVGKIVEYLERNRLLGNTIIILTSDHGESLGEHGEMTHGFLAYNTTLWVPLIIVVPGVRESRVDGYVAHIDIFPTICDGLGIPIPKHLEGLSLLPAARGKRVPDRELYFESLYPYYQRGWAPLRGLIFRKHKYIESPIAELYDLDKDFGETENIIGRVPAAEFQKRLGKVIAARPPEAKDARARTSDRETLERLASLGYLSGPGRELKAGYGPEDDVKVLLPFYNRAVAALDLHHSGQSGQAAAMLTEIISDRPDLDVAHSMLATLRKDEGRLGDALEVLRRGLAAIPASYEIFVTYANFLLDAGRFQELVELVDQASHRQMDHDPEIWNYLGLAHLQRGDFKGAESSFQKAIAIDAEYAAVHANLGTTSLYAWMQGGDPSVYEKSLQHFRKAIELDPSSAMAHNGLGAALFQAGRVDDAVACWERALELEPRLCEALFNLGLVSLGKGDKARALSYLENYKKTCGPRLSPEERRKLEDLISRCR